MAVCRRCHQPFPDERKAAGLDLCIECGDSVAWEELEQKHKRIGVAWNKGPEMYLGSPNETKRILKTEGARKHLPIEDSSQPQIKPKSKTKMRKVPNKRWEFERWEFPVDEFGVRYKRAILKPKQTGE